MSGRNPRRHRSRGTRRLTAVVAVLASVLVGVLATPSRPAEAAPVLPAGWVLTDRPSGLDPQADTLTDFDFLPDGSVLSISKEGKIAWSSVDGSVNRILGTIPVMTDADLGLVGMSLARDFATSGHVFLTASQMINGSNLRRVLRVTVTGSPTPTGFGSQQTIIEFAGDYPTHSLTGVLQAADGTLWISNGDNSDWKDVDPDALRNYQLDNPHGKLLHINPDGTGVPTNPFYNAAAPNSWRSRVYASGFRSPFRLSIDPGSGAPIVGDVGWTRWEEINLVRPGANYGWPCWEGNEPTNGYKDLPGCANASHTPPTWAYPHVGGIASITGGFVYTGSSYPEAYRGAYFFGDYALGFLSTMVIGPDGSVIREPEPRPGRFATGLGGPVSLRPGPNGDVVFADIYSGVLRRLSYTPGNRPPTAQVTTTTTPATRTVAFDGSTSYDLDGDLLTYSWDFGDGSTDTGATVSHSYAADPATFTARLTVTDPAGASHSTDVTVAPSNYAPELNLTAPPAGQTYAVGALVQATATATDAEDGTLTPQLRWRTKLVHCGSAPGAACHDHPDSDGAPGGSFSREFVDHGGYTHLEVTAMATDAAGVTTSRSFKAYPRLRTLTLGSNVPATMTIAGDEVSTAPVTVGATLSFSAPTTAADGVATFELWSDGGAQARTGFVMPDNDVTINATYLTPIDRRYNGDAGLRVKLGAPTGAEQGASALRWRDYATGRLYWTPAGGVKEVHGGIAQAYIAQGSHVRFGVPTNDETPVGDGVGVFNDFAGTASSGKASIYYTDATGAHSVYGGIRVEWERMGLATGRLGYPTTDELGTPDGVGRYNHFSRGASIYYHPSWGANEIHGAIRAKWAELGWEQSALGYPRTPERATPDGIGAYNHFSNNGSIHWSPTTGAHEVRGAIRNKWAEHGWEGGRLGYPTTDELGTPDGVGAYNHFQKTSSVYWSPGTGAHSVHNAIRNRWAQLGWERSYLGYPTSDEYAISGGARSDFQRGYIIWYTNGQVIDRRY